jgi:hypothetical protein
LRFTQRKKGVTMSSKHIHTIEADSTDEFRAKVAELHEMLGAKEIPDLSHTVVQSQPAAKEAGKSVETAPARGRGRPPVKKVEAAPAPAPAPAPQEAEVGEAQAAEVVADDPFADEPTQQEEQVTLTLDDVKAIAQKVVEVKGMPELKKIVLEFKAGKLADLKEEQYGPFIEKCGKLLPKAK